MQNIQKEIFSTLVGHFNPLEEITGLVCNDPKLLTANQMFPTLQHLVKKSSDEHYYHIGFEEPDLDFDESIASSATGFSMKYPYKVPIIPQKLNSFVHDFTFAIFSDSTDQPMKSFAALGDENDNRTPDYIRHIMGNKYVVLEFATTEVNQEYALLDRFKTKLEAYYEALNQRQEAYHLYVLYGIIVVSKTKVVTNIDLPQEIVEELCQRFRASLPIGAQFRAAGEVESTGLKHFHEKMDYIKKKISEVPIDWNKLKQFKPFNKRLYNNHPMMTMDSNYVGKVLCHSRIKAVSKLATEHYLLCDHGKDCVACTKLEKRVERNQKECEALIKNYEKKMDPRYRPTEFASGKDNSAVVQLPLWIATEDTDTATLLDSKIGNEAKNSMMQDIGFTKDLFGDVWHSAIEEVNSGRSQRVIEDVDAERNIAYDMSGKLETEYLPQRSQFRRVFLNYSNSTAIEMAKLGVNGKKYENDPVVKQNAAEKKKSLPLNVFTGDIEDFINNFYKLLVSETVQTKQSLLIQDLLHIATKLHGDSVSDAWNQNLDQFNSSAFGNLCAMISEIGFELSAACKQHCPIENEFILKKIRHYPLYMLIKPTRYGSHLFVSFMIQKDKIHPDLSQNNNCFKKWREGDSSYWTDFVSFNVSKLRNLGLCHAMMYNLTWFFHEFYKVPFFQENVFNSEVNPEVSKMIAIAFLLLLNDKAETEELVTYSRYNIMEGFTIFPRLPKPHKMVKKMPDVIRSRLQAWLIKKNLICMKRITNLNGFNLVRDGDTVLWQNLFNFFTGEPILDPYQVINLFYLGYVKNKEETGEKNSTVKMFEKVTIYEDKVPKSMRYLGFEDPPIDKIQFHEFSPSMVKYATKLSLKKLRLMHGENIEEQIEKSILHNLAEKTMDSLCTLKATSNFNEEMYKYVPGTEYHRERVAAAMRFIFEEGNNHLVDVLEKCLKIIEKQGCMHIDMFKKPQHGGLREIYVLAAAERIIQCFLETISRSICEFFPNETMTHPDNKFQLPYTHFSTSAKMNERSTMTICTSDDAEKWNQGHFVTKFALMLCMFTPTWMHNVIMRGCAMFMVKRIMIDDGLMAIIEENSDLLTSNETLQKMSDAYWGITEQKWMKQGNRYIETQSGMMQGILHYTSSLFHSIFLELLQNEVTASMNSFTKQFSEKNLVPKGRFLITHLNSSDDSALMISFPCRNQKELQEGLIACNVAFEMKKELGIFFGIYTSIKSTSGTPWMFEFNSEFTFHNNLFRPTLRWVIASVDISEQEHLVGRQEEMASNLTNVLTGGGSFSLTAACQMGQGILHYQMLGSGVSPLFEEFKTILALHPDPAMGFFLVDQPFFAGVGGFRYNLWNCLKNSIIEKKYAIFMKTMQEQELVLEGIGEKPKKSLFATTSGTFCQGTIIRFGNAVKWKRLLKKMDLPDDFLEYTDDHPEMLYKRPETFNDFLYKLAIKMHSPGVSTSLGKGNAFARIVASSVYIISRKVILDDVDWILHPGEKSQKFSLLSRLVEGHEMINHNNLSLTDDQYRRLFPFEEDFYYLRSLCEGLTEIQGNLVYTRHRKVATRIDISESESVLIFKPEQLVAWKWFPDHDLPASHYAIKRQWELLKKAFPWLKDNPTDSLKDSPFEHHIQLQNFLSRLDRKHRSFVLLGAPVKTRAGMSNVMTAARQNFFPGWSMLLVHDEEALQRHTDLTDAMHLSACITQGPFLKNVKERLFNQVANRYPNLPIREEFGVTDKNALSMILHFASMDKTEEELGAFVQDIKRMKMGYIGGFVLKSEIARTSEGSFLGYKGESRWLGCVDGIIVLVHMDNVKTSDLDFSNCIKAVEISKFSQMYSLRGFLVQISKVFKLKTDIFSKFIPGSLEKTLIKRFYQNKFIHSSEQVGFPIYENKNLIFYQEKLTKDDFEIGFDQRSVKIYQILRSKKVGVESKRTKMIMKYYAGEQLKRKFDEEILKFPILTVNFKESHYMEGLSSTLYDEIFQHDLMARKSSYIIAWIQNLRLRTDDFMKIVKVLKDNPQYVNRAGMNHELLLDNLKTQFRYALLSVGVKPKLKSMFLTSEERIFSAQEIFEEFGMETSHLLPLLEDLEPLNVELPEEDILRSEDIYGAITLNTTATYNFEEEVERIAEWVVFQESTEVHLPRTHNLLRGHVDYLLSIIPNLANNLTNETFPSHYKNHLSVICYLLDLDESDFRLDEGEGDEFQDTTKFAQGTSFL